MEQIKGEKPPQTFLYTILIKFPVMKLAMLLPLLSLSPEKFLEGTVKRP